MIFNKIGTRLGRVVSCRVAEYEQTCSIQLFRPSTDED